MCVAEIPLRSFSGKHNERDVMAHSWQELEPILEEAAELEGSVLQAWLERTPEELRPQIQVLLGDGAEYGPWAAEAVARIIEGKPRLAVPSELGPYRIVRHLASGGMGEVYEAEDPRLRRKVAVKVLHAGAVRRLDEEAQALASLRHPNICRIYDVGRTELIEYFVMELLDGVPLSERLKKGPLPLVEGLAIGRALASALAEAHRIGIVHRDVKPANILLTRSGPSLVDFGIANFVTAGAGIPAGTPPYMAPEQARGLSDPRSDIYSAGAVLREMLGDNAPAGVSNVVDACLAEDPDDRWQSAADLARALQWTVEPVRPAASTPWWQRWWVGYAAAALVSLAAGMWIWNRGERPHPPVLVPLRTTQNHSIQDERHIAVSPDATRVAFIAPGEAGERLVWIRKLSEMSASALPSTVGASHVFWSPDGESIGFFRDKLMQTLHLGSGALRTLVEAPGAAQRAVWHEDSRVVYSVRNIQGKGVVYRISSTGGKPETLTRINSADEELMHAYPVPLPGTDHFLFNAISSPVIYSADSPGHTYLASTHSPDARTLLFRGAVPVGAVEDRVYFVRESKLWSRRFDGASAQWNGDARLEVSGVRWAHVTPSGVVTYMPAAGKGRPAWVDRQGRKISDVPVPEGFITAVGVSSDGSALVTRQEEQSAAIGLWVVRGNEARRLASEFGRYNDPYWSDDGKWIYFGSYAEGVYRRLPEPGAEEELVMPRNLEDKTVSTTTRDGRYAYFTAHNPANNRGFDIFRYDLKTRTRREWRVTEVNETQPRLSPDEKWMAWLCEYTRTSGRLCVSPPDDPRNITFVTATPANEHTWSRDGRQIYFTFDEWLYSVPVSFVNGKVTSGTPERLFRLCELSSLGPRYDVDSDTRFLVREVYRPAPDPILVWK